MRRFVVATLMVVCAGGVVQGQGLTPPPGGAGVFGAAPGGAFDEKAMFANPPAGLPPPAKQVTIPDGSLPPPPPRIWTGGLEFGLNGSQGDLDVVNLKFGGFADRKTDRNVFHTDLLYTLNTSNQVVSQNQALWYTRDEVLFKDSPWSLFGSLQIEYDRLRPYDLRVGLYAGVSYAWVDNGTTLFKTRAGAGAQREMSTRRGGPADRWVPEAVMGFDFNHKFSDRQSFISSVDVYPSLNDINQYRVRARAAYEILINPEYGMALRLGVQERYDSKPGPGGQSNSLNYFATLVVKF